MEFWTVAIGIASLGTTGVYGYVGNRLFHRPVAPASRLAATQFALWWYGLAATAAITGVEALLEVAGVLSYPMAITAYLVSLLVAVAVLWGIVGYLTYLYTGRYYVGPLTVFYAIFYVAVVYYVFSEGPTGFAVTGGTVGITYAGTGPLALAVFVVVGLIVPEFAGAIAYLSLLRRTRDRTLRYRITMVGMSVLLWFLFSLLISGESGPASFARAIAGAGTAVIALVGLLPPAWIRDRLHVAAVPGPEPSGPEVAART